MPDRTARTLSAWLDRHAGTEIVCRDRASSYAEAVRTSAPDAVQVADRFHVWQNIADAVERCVIAHRSCLSAAASATDTEPPPEPEQPREGKCVTNTHQRHAAVHELHNKRVGTTRIAQILGMDPKTVRRYARAATAEDLIVPARSQHSPLRPFQSYLDERWNGGCTDSTRLSEEIRALGYRGTDRTVRRWLERLRASSAPVLKVSDVPSTRKVTGWITRHPDNLISNEALRLNHLLNHCPELATVVERVRDFAVMMANREGHRLPEWITATETTELAPLRGFASNLRKDLDDVTAGLTLEWNIGPVEGHENRIKMLKRQMFGRANLDLLRLRILLNTS
ncbi:transposase [Streptomyces netropsis]|uniref:transposase n=1 Tax=Streptomyces netropsis TaxID=55404 RepID=UPI0037A7586A